MVLLNKVALSSFGFQCPNALLLFQCALCAALVQISGLVGAIKLEPWSAAITKIWFPVNLIFVAMIGTSFYSLKMLGVTPVSEAQAPDPWVLLCARLVYRALRSSNSLFW